MAGSDEAAKVNVEAGQQAHDAILRMLSDSSGGAGWWSNFVADAVGGIVAATSAVVMAIFGALFRVGSELATIFLTSMEGVVRDNQDALNSLVAAAMTDLLSVDVSGADIGPGGDPAAQVQRARQIGGKLHDLLVQEFGGTGGPEGINGQAAARAFTGFNISFATRAALISILTEFESLGFIKSFREIGEEMAESLGLGRLHRRAMQPLIQHLIALPYDRQLSAQYRQKRLSLVDYVNAQTSGFFGNKDFTTDFHELGLRDEDLSIAAIMLSKKITERETDSLSRFGEVPIQYALLQLQQSGYDAYQAEKIVRAAQLQRVDRLELEYAAELLAMYKAGHIDIDKYQSELDLLHFTEEELGIWSKRALVVSTSKRKHLSWSQMLLLYEHAQITIGDIDQWATQQGYDANDLLNLELIAAIKSNNEDERLKVLKFKWQLAVAAAGKKGDPAPPPPPGVTP